MRDPLRSVLTAVALAVCAAQGAARAGDDGVGEMVVSGRSVCKVEVDKGAWLYLVTDGEGGRPVRGWARRDQVKTVNKAIEDHSERISARPDAALFYDRGRFWQTRGEYEIAIADFDEVLRADPRCARAYYHRGSSWTDKGANSHEDADIRGADIRRGLADLDTAIRLDPASVTFYCDRGSAWMKLGKVYAGRLGDAERDLERFEEWLRLTREYEDARRRSETLDNPGSRIESGVLKASPDDPGDERRSREIAAVVTRREYLKVVKYARIDTNAAFKSALADFEAAIRLDPKDPRGYARREQVRAFLASDPELASARP
jgi:tetratricopeptide (TPR) repeat protein